MAKKKEQTKKMRVEQKQKIVISVMGVVIIVLAALLFIGNMKEKLTITFDSNGGSTIKEQKVKKDELVKKPTSPTKEGYTFLYWELDNEEYDFDSKVTKKITLVAKYGEAVEGTYSVTFNSDGGSKVTSQNIKIGEKIVKPENPTKKGYKFLYWKLDGKEYSFKEEVAKDMILVAKWEKAEAVVTYKVTFNSDGGSKVAAKTVNSGSKVTKPKAPTKSGFTFNGWYLKDKLYNFSTAVKEDITLTAKWTAVVVKDVYKIKDESFQTGSPQVIVRVYKNGSSITAKAVLDSSGETLGTYNSEFSVILVNVNEYSSIKKVKLNNGDIVDVSK